MFRQRGQKIPALDAVRGFAALYVVIAHIVHFMSDGSLIRLVFRFSQEAVILFFLLSGAVIYLSQATRQDQRFIPFFVRRFRRIYFPFVICLVVTTVVVGAVRGFDDFRATDLFGNILMLQDAGKPGGFVNNYMYNNALWSLSYEWWFYLMFFPLWKRLCAQKCSGIWYVLGMSLLAWFGYLLAPSHLWLVVAYFILWWAGLELCRAYVERGRVDWIGVRTPVCVLSIMAAASAIPVLTADRATLDFGLFPLLIVRHFLMAVFIVAALVAWSKLGFRGYRWTLRPFRLVAPISYAVYVLHYPILVDWGLHGATNAMLLFVCVPVLLVLSWLVEVRWQPKVDAWSNGLLRYMDQRSKASNGAYPFEAS
jgi:peptidoglycan/LPS O-acetylase OafA/YrhL